MIFIINFLHFFKNKFLSFSLNVFKFPINLKPSFIYQMKRLDSWASLYEQIIIRSRSPEIPLKLVYFRAVYWTLIFLLSEFLIKIPKLFKKLIKNSWISCGYWFRENADMVCLFSSSTFFNSILIVKYSNWIKIS